MMKIKIDYNNDPEEELEYWQEMYGLAIQIKDRETIDELKRLLPILEERITDF